MRRASLKRLGDLINLKRGYDLPESKRTEGTHPVISSAGVSGFHSEYKVDGKGVVIGRYGTLGDAYYVEGKYWPHNTSLYVTDFKGNFPKYIYYLLKCIGRIKTSDKSAVPGVNRNELHEMAVPAISDVRHQELIAHALAVLDSKIEINNSINQELQTMSKLLYEYWFVQFDFPMSHSQAKLSGKPDLVGKPYRSSGGRMVFVEALNREIPADWNLCCLGDISENIRDTIDPASVEQGTPYVGLEHVPRRKFFLDDWCVSESVTSLKSRFDVGDILFGKLRPYFHKVVRAPIHGICTSEILVLRPKNRVYEALVGSVLFSDSFVESTSKQWGGAQMPRAAWKRMVKFLLPLPTEDLLAEFNSHVLPLWKFGGENQKQNVELSRLRDWLLPMLMSGQVAVSE